MSAQTSASSRSGDPPPDRPPGPKSHIRGLKQFTEQNQEHAVYSAGPKNRERAQNRVRHCKTALPVEAASKNESAAAGVEARNGAEKVISWGKIERNDKAQPPALASHLVALIDREGRVTGVFAGRAAARSFLQGGRA